MRQDGAAGVSPRKLDSNREVCQIHVSCVDSGIRQFRVGNDVRYARTAPMEFEARLYTDNDSSKPYFRGLGKTDTEAIGALICHCPEKFNASITIVNKEDFMKETTEH